MKKQRTEKTVRRSFIYMVKTSKIAVKQRKQRKKAPKIRCFLWQGQKDLNPRHAVLEWLSRKWNTKQTRLCCSRLAVNKGRLMLY